VSGVTPSLALIRAVREAVSIPIHVLVRSRPGDFIYTADEVATMADQIYAALEAGATGVVVGALTRGRTADREALTRWCEAASGRPVYAHHMADFSADLVAAVEVLVDIGFSGVLTGGALGADGTAMVEQGIPMLRRLVSTIGNRITVLAGGSLRAANVRRVVTETGVREVHLGFRNGSEPDAVRAVVAALASLDT
jgi:copper homeostasis protein